jgi:cytochrome b6-f complex iron-sulfur subunit
MSERAQDTSRRDFIKGVSLLIGGAIGAMIGLPSIAFLLSPAADEGQTTSWIDLGPVERYPTGTPTLFEFTQTRVYGWERTAVTGGAFVVRDEAAGIRVFSNVCTHLACRVRWHPELQHYISPCHDGHFDMLGNNVSGPPPRPLDEFRTRVEGGHLYIELPAIRRTA